MKPIELPQTEKTDIAIKVENLSTGYQAARPAVEFKPMTCPLDLLP